MDLRFFGGLNRAAALLACGALLGCGDDGSDAVQDPTEGLESGHAATWMGLKGDSGFNGDGRHRTQTQISQPQDLLFMSDGSAWLTDFNNFLIRRILPDGTVETMVGGTDPIFPGDGPLDGIPPTGAPGLEWELNHPTALLQNFDDDSILVVGWHNHKLLTVDPEDGFVKVVCGGGAGFQGDGELAAKKALFKQPNDATFDEDGNLYIVDQQNERIRRIDPDGIITTIAGTGVRGYSGDDGPALEAEFSWAVGSNPNPSGGIVYHAGKLYISDTEADVIRVMDLDSGVVEGFAGTGQGGYSGNNGPALQAMLNAPRDLEIGPDGDLYFADTDNGAVRAIDLDTNVIRAVVGNGTLGLDDEEGRLATRTKLRRPFGIAFDPDGNLYVLDSLNDRIVKVAK
jgi:DNA-binding beta-propeller fold protein YncE